MISPLIDPKDAKVLQHGFRGIAVQSSVCRLVVVFVFGRSRSSLRARLSPYQSQTMQDIVM